MTLPKFLLAWSDFNWLCLFAKLRPAKNESWTIFRVLGLTALTFAIGAAIGLVLALVLMREPVGWLPWLLGLVGGCVGLCWFGVTALCWNQRARQLRANPALPTELPKSRYPFFRWCLGFVYFVVLGVLTPFALMVTVENIRGEITWKREHARLVAAGEKLTFREILGPEIPATQNAGAAAVFAPLFDYEHHPVKQVRGEDGEIHYAGGLEWLQSNRLAQLEMVFKTPADYLPEGSKGSRQVPTTPLINVADWSAAYRAAAAKARPDDAAWVGALQLPPPGDPVRDVLAALSRADAELAEVSGAAALPRAQFPVHYEEAFDALLRHLSVLKGAQQTLQLRCAAHLAAGETDAAFADATNAINVAELMREEPLLISQLVRYAQLHIAVNTLWQGLAQHRWSDSQLESLQRRLADVDCLSGLVLSFEGERAGAIVGMERLIHDPQFYDNFMGEPPLIVRLLRIVPRSVLRQNQTTLAHYQSTALAALRAGISNAPQTGLLAVVQSRDSKLEHVIPQTYSPYTVMMAMLAPATGKAINKTARVQTVVQLAIVACALERYRLAHGEFPERLDQLAPRFSPSVPLDPMINQPFHYTRTDDGWFQLYSVGLNGTDDGGVMFSGEKGDKEEKDWPWPVPTRPMHPRLF